jgi:hypothetical protein
VSSQEEIPSLSWKRAREEKRTMESNKVRDKTRQDRSLPFMQQLGLKNVSINDAIFGQC